MRQEDQKADEDYDWCGFHRVSPVQSLHTDMCDSSPWWRRRPLSAEGVRAGPQDRYLGMMIGGKGIEAKERIPPRRNGRLRKFAPRNNHTLCFRVRSTCHPHAATASRLTVCPERLHFFMAHKVRSPRSKYKYTMLHRRGTMRIFCSYDQHRCRSFAPSQARSGVSGRAPQGRWFN